MKRRDFAMGLTAGGLTAGGLTAAAAPCAHATTEGPAGQRLTSAATAALGRAWARRDADPRRGRTDALVVLHNGGLVFEAYGPEHGPETPHVSWSLAKSVTHALTGIAVAERRIDIDQPLAIVAHPAPGLTLRRLLNLTDGLAWKEEGYSGVDSDARRMLFGPGRLDTAAYVAGQPQAYPPGVHWRYSTGAFLLAAAELQSRLFPEAKSPQARRAAMADWMQSRLFQPLGMKTAIAEFDPAGTFVGGSMVYASARDFARLGELYRCDGVWAGRRLLPEGWVRFARTPTIEPTYGSGFWLETEASHDPAPLLGGRGPSDAFSGQGHFGQVLMIIPSRALILVRLGQTKEGGGAWGAIGEWLSTIIAAFPAVAAPRPS